MNDIQCCICHENVRIPVRFICFPCETLPGQPSCNSITRVCLLCAREYLQLNKKRSGRITYRKCLTCPATVRCASLSAVSSYEKDFFIMSRDPKEDYSCFYDLCSFRGTHTCLAHHIQTDCPFRTISCRLCKTYFQAMDEDKHIQSCPERFCCFCCHQYIPIHEEMDHYLEHDLKRCNHCHQWISKPLLLQHNDVCPECPCACVYCNKNIPRIQMHNHLIEHVNVFIKTIMQNNAYNNEFLRLIPFLLQESKKYV